MSAATVASAVVMETAVMEAAVPEAAVLEAVVALGMAVFGPECGRGGHLRVGSRWVRAVERSARVLQIGGSVVESAVASSLPKSALVSARLDKRALHVTFRATLRAPTDTHAPLSLPYLRRVRAADIGRDARLSGWCHRIRDHGGLLFIDLRDHYASPMRGRSDSPFFRDIEKLRSEWLVRLDGKVRHRPEGTVNPDLPSGAIELFISGMEVLGAAGELPCRSSASMIYPEDIRLKVPFLDLRREHLHQNIMKRGAIIDSLRPAG